MTTKDELPSGLLMPTLDSTVIAANSAGPAARHATAAALLAGLTETLAARSYEDALRQLGAELQSWSECDRVIVGVSNRRGECRVVHISEAARIDERCPSVRAMQAALDETLGHESIQVWTSADATDSPIFRQLARWGDIQAVLAVPLRGDDGQPIGALLLCSSSATYCEPPRVEQVAVCQRPVAICLERLRQSLGSWHYRLQQRWQQARQQQLGRIIAAAAMILSGPLVLPYSYRIRCDVFVEPVTRRFVASPFDGTLSKAFVEPGDIVHADDVLARLDDRELRWELTGLEAEYVAARKRRETALANREAVSAQLATLEMEQIDTKVKTLQNRTEHLTIHCPIEGVVLSGDLKRTEGAPVTIGQALFEVAPLGKMIAEIEVPQDEVGRVADKMPVELRFEAFPHVTWTGVIAKLQPRAELRQQRSVFIAEVILENRREQLRPGMKGTATITGQRYALGWILFHRAADLVVQKLGW